MYIRDYDDSVYEALIKVFVGVGTLQDLRDMKMMRDQLYELSNYSHDQTSGSPLKDILAHLRAEVETHVNLKVCPAGVCQMSGKRV